MRQWAVTVGISHYQNFQPLSYAEQDAQALHHFLMSEAGFLPEQCFLLTDTSPAVWGRPTYPDRETIQNWLELLTRQYLEPGDVLWYFFSGYGVCHQGQDYLMPIEGDPRALEATAIPAQSIFNLLQGLATETVLVLLDMNRNQGALSYDPLGEQTAALARRTGISTILSCQPGQFSRETAALQHGFFTAALLESLRYRQCATIANLDRYLSDRLPELSDQYWKPIQQPLIISPPEKVNQVILPQMASFPVVDGFQPEALLHYQNGYTPISLLNGATNHSRTAIATTASGVATGSNGYHSVTTNGTSVSSSQPLAPTPIGSATVPISMNGNGSSQTGAERLAHSSVPGSYSPATQPVPPPPNPPVTDEAAEIPDAVFWRPLLLWGGIAIALLMLGVLLKNWKSLTQGIQSVPQPTIENPQPVTPSRPNPVSPKPSVLKPSPQPPKTADPVGTNPKRDTSQSKTRKGQPSNTSNDSEGINLGAKGQLGDNSSDGSQSSSFSQSLLSSDKAKALIQSDQASPFWYAIQGAKKIPANHPEYRAAQQAISDWSRQILIIANRRAKRKNFDGAILAAALVPRERPLYNTAQLGTARWCQSTKWQGRRNPVQARRVQTMCSRFKG